MNVPFLDLKQQYHGIQDEILRAVINVLESAQFVLGSEVEAFEREFAAWTGCQHAVGVSTGTSALHLAMVAAGIGPGDEVITVPCTFVATVAAITYTGAKPVFVDVDPVTYTMSARQVEALITPRTKALLPVHLYGHPADMGVLMNIARRNNLILIEDAAQAHGAEFEGRKCGSIGDLGCFSFYPGKNLGAYGEGGIVTTNDPELARRIRMLRNWGAEKRYQHEMKGFNYRMQALQGAILRVKLRYIDHWTESRREHAASYRMLLQSTGLHLPFEAPGCKRGVETNIHYPTPIHLLPAYSDFGYKEGDFPVSEHVARRELSLPMFPELSRSQIEFVAELVSSFAATEPGVPAAFVS
jgi:dTDP-4-amino-4,6-dideoxygalactose transaminase